MSYKFKDFLGDLKRRLLDIFDNHLFMIFFIVFIVFFGTFGIWIKPLFFSDNVNWMDFPNNFNTLALLSYCAPFIAVTFFDSVVRLLTKFHDDSSSIDLNLLVWFTLITIIYFSIVALLFAIGAKSGADYSSYSSCAWFMVLLYWALVNIDNPSYKRIGSKNSPTGTDKYEKLMRGDK